MRMANHNERISDVTLENLKVTVRRSFARLYATLKAKELKTLRQIEAIKKKYESQTINGIINSSLKNIEITYENESKIVFEISKYGNINFEKLNVDSDVLFTPEDYDCPDNDHMYSYKCIDDVIQSVDPDTESLKAFIEQEAMRQVTEAEDCVCHVTIHPTEVSMKFKETPNIVNKPLIKESQDLEHEIDSTTKSRSKDDLSEQSIDEKLQSNNPTQDWMNLIKSQIETEPSQINDVMEHSTIDCTNL